MREPFGVRLQLSSRYKRDRYTMTIAKRIASFFHLQGDAWKRHANPWSVWLRTTVLSALILSAWSRIWICWWALVSGVLAIWLTLFGATLVYAGKLWFLDRMVWLYEDMGAAPPT